MKDMLTHLNEYKVAEVTDENGNWVLHFENGMSVHNFDPTIEWPDVAGKTLLSVEYGKVTTMNFGSVKVALDPLQYAIGGHGELVWPERDEEEDDTPEDPSPLRVVEGPEEDAS